MVFVDNKNTQLKTLLKSHKHIPHYSSVQATGAKDSSGTKISTTDNNYLMQLLQILVVYLLM